MNLDQFIEFLIQEGEINRDVIEKSLEVDAFPLARKILLKIEGQTTLLENILKPKNEGELILAKGELLRICILNDQDVKQQGIKFIDELIKKVREKFNLYPSEKKEIKNKNSNKPTSKSNETIQESEKNLSSLIQQAEEFYELKDYSKAIDYYWKAICLNPNNDKYFFNRGLCYYELDENEEAIENFNNAINLNPNNDEYFLNRGLCYYELDENEEAIENFDNAIKLNPNVDRYFYYRSKAKLDSTEIYKINNIIEDLTKAHNLNSLVEDLDLKEKILITRARLLNQKREYKKCLKDYSEVISLNCDIDYLSERIEIYKEQCKYDKAIEDIRECCKLDPDNCLLYKSRLIDTSEPKPYYPYVSLIEIYRLEQVRKRYREHYRESKRPLYPSSVDDAIKAEIQKINKENAKARDSSFKGKVSNYLLDRKINPEYRERMKNLFGIDGEDDFKTAVFNYIDLSEWVTKYGKYLRKYGKEEYPSEYSKGKERW